MKKTLLTIIILLSALSGSAWGFDIRERITNELIKASPWEGADVEVEDIDVPGIERVRYDDCDIRLPKGVKNLGKVSFEAVLKLNGKEVKNIWASARVNVYKEVVVALNTLKMNRRVTKDDVRLVRTGLKDAPDAMTILEDALGMVVKRPISAGSVVKREFLKPETIIKKGDKLIVWIDSPKIRLKTAAIATVDGYRGGVVTARSSSGREINGVVTGYNELTVVF